MPIEAVVLIMVWIAAGIVGAWFLNRRSGRRSGFWYGVCLVLGPFGLPIAWEMSAERPTDVVERRAGYDRGGLRVLAAVDGSGESERAVRDAIDLLGMRIGSLVLVHVLDYTTHADEREENVASATHMLSEVALRLPVQVPEPSLEVAVGRPANGVCELARSERADLVVVGHSGAGMSRSPLGGVAEDVSRHSPVPVLLGAAVPDRVL